MAFRMEPLAACRRDDPTLGQSVGYDAIAAASIAGAALSGSEGSFVSRSIGRDWNEHDF
jgi:ribose/xylose/arabinose/galactoside ABC-type transport system permease subunit